MLSRQFGIVTTHRLEQLERAMEDVRNHAGVIKTYAQPYRPGVRDALEEADIFFCRYNRDGALLPVAS